MKKILIFVLVFLIMAPAQAMQTRYSDGTPTGYLPNGNSWYKERNEAELDYIMMTKHPKAYKKFYKDFERNKPKIYVNKFVKMQPHLDIPIETPKEKNQKDINNAIYDVMNGDN